MSVTKGATFFTDGMTIKQLKELIKDWPETNPATGEDVKVWLGFHDGTSNMVTEVWPLSAGDGTPDLILE